MGPSIKGGGAWPKAEGVLRVYVVVIQIFKEFIGKCSIIDDNLQMRTSGGRKSENADKGGVLYGWPLKDVCKSWPFRPSPCVRIFWPFHFHGQN